MVKLWMLEPIKTLDLSKNDYSVDTMSHHDYLEIVKIGRTATVLIQPCLILPEF